jgi:hypothetical protein
MECNTLCGEKLYGAINKFMRCNKDVTRGKIMGCDISRCQKLFCMMDKLWSCNISTHQYLFSVIGK